MRTRLFACALPALFLAACSGDGQKPETLLEPRIAYAIGTDSVTGATIQTNLDDYYPGQVVHLTGSGWAASETVSLVMTEDPDTHDDVVMDVVADSSGAFAFDFYHVEVHDIGVTFTLKATGQTSGSVAVATFTDGNVQVKTSGVTVALTWEKFTGSAACSGTASESNSATISGTTGFTKGVNGGQSIKLTVPASSGSSTFSSWSTGATTQAICVPGSNGSGQQAVTANYTTDATPPVITPNITGTLGNNGWYVSDVYVTWTVSDPESSYTVTGCAPVTITADQAAMTYECSATSAGGTISSPVTIKRDATLPNVLGNRSPEANLYGWNNSSVTVSFTGTDALSGLAGCNSPVVVSSEGENQSVSGSCTDNAGNTAWGLVGFINIDRTAPTNVSGNAAAPPSANGWYNTDVIVTFSGTDVLSGIDSCTQRVLSDEGAGQSVTGTCTDRAGNVSATATVAGINIDRTAPTGVSGTVSPDANANGWHNTAVTVSFAGSDALSGIDFCDDVVVSTDGADQSASGTCTDNAGNESAPATVSGINIDRIAPLASADRSPNANAYGWNNSDVTVTFTGSDALSGFVSCTPAVVVLSAEGANQSVSGSCTDRAGNSATVTASGINIDKTAPTAFASRTPAANAYGWNHDDVTVSFSGLDALSDIASCDPAVVLSTEGADQSASGSCTDKAGNVSALATVSGINIDRTVPADISFVGGFTSSGYYFGSVPAAPTCTADGAISGLASCNVTGYSATVGTHTLTATATDKAGNSATATTSYTVYAWTFLGFYQPVDMPVGTTPVWNTVKGGSTVPLKFELFAGPTELTTTSSVLQPLQAQQLACTGGTEDTVELTATGGTTLRYDSLGGQFIYNWQTPKKPGFCYRVTVVAQDGSSRTAYFRLK